MSAPAAGATQPPVQWVKKALHPGVNQRKREAEHSPSFSAQVKNEWSYSAMPHTISRRQ